MRRKLLLASALAFLALGALACAPKPAVKAPKASVSKSQRSQAQKVYLEGAYLYAEGDTDKAIAAFKKALSIDPGHVQARTALKEALAKKKAIKALDTR